MNGMTINNLSNPDDVDFILALLGSHFVVNNLTYSLSDSELFNVRSSTVEISDITFNNILNAGQLAEVSDCDNTTIDGIKSVNSTVSKQYLFTFSELRNSTISQLQVNNSESVVMLVDLSTETRLENVEIRNCTEGIEIRSSSIDSFRGSNLTNNGGESLLLAGAIKIIDSLVNMINNTFNSNTAVTGGAIYFTCSSLTLCGLTISDTVFENNQATEKGGAIYYDYLRPDLQSSIVFTSNTAQYGPDIASYAVKITFEQEPDAPLRIEEVGSGISIPEALRFAVRDYDNQIMNLDNQDQVTMSAVDNNTTQVRGFNAAALRNGVAEFDNLIIIAEPGSQNVQVSASSNAIDQEKILEIFGAEISSNTITTNLRHCRPGELLEGGACRVCSPGTYSLKWNSPVCSDCMSDAVCEGGSVVNVNFGHWRKTLNSTSIIE